MRRAVLGIDTSCYTTSVACFDSAGVRYDGRKVLPVERGARGLRQSEAVFLHTRQLPPLVEEALRQVPPGEVAAVACSASPTETEDSYMPVFLTGLGVARALAAAWQVPLLMSNHQSGHIRSALIGQESLLASGGFYAVHLSGGTTDLLLVHPTAPGKLAIELLGRGEDLHAGQMVDRVGVALGCGFPAGRELEALAREATAKNIRIPASVQENGCSFSGGESAAQRLIGQGEFPAEVAYGIYDLLARTLSKWLNRAQQARGRRPVLLCGGVSSSGLLRELLEERTDLPLFFGDSRLCSDNAVGVAALGFDQMEARGWS